jgi:hypothetical protein
MSFSKLSDLLTGRFRFLRTAAPPPEGHVDGSSHRYDPHQPRVPAGHRDGGRWTGFADLAGASRRGAEPQSDETRLAFDGTNFPLPRPGIKVGRRAQRPEELLSLLEILSAGNGPNAQAVVEFRSHAFEREASSPFDFSQVVRLNREQLKEHCHRFDDVQKAVNKAAETLSRTEPNLTRQQFGQNLHSEVEKLINSQGSKDFRAEMSILDGREGRDPAENRNKAGSIRPDVREIPPAKEGETKALELLKKDTVCFYEIKTGDQRLRPGRSRKVAKAATILTFAPPEYEELIKQAFPGVNVRDIKRIIVTQVKPTVQ